MAKEKIMSRRKYPCLIYLEWGDALSRFNETYSLEEAQKWGERSHWHVKGTYWLLDEKEKYILVAKEMVDADFSDPDIFRTLTKIPTTWIKKKRFLKI